MKKQATVILWAFVALIASVLSCGIAIGIVIADAVYFPEDKFSEEGLVENCQVLFLFLAALIYLYQAVNYKNRFYILICGNLLCMVIRELDAFFDKFSHGSWSYIATAVALVFIFWAFKVKEGFYTVIRDMAEVIVSKRAFCWLFAGIVVSLAFSRLFGMKVFWMYALGDDYLQIMKRMAEETLELWGYILIFFASFINLIEEKAACCRGTNNRR